MKKLAVFVSGSGSNLQSIIDNIESGFISNTEIAIIVSSKHNVYALERAKKHNIYTKVFSKADYKNIEELYFELDKVLKKIGIDYIVLAGYLSIIPKSFIKSYENKIINIHPSLIPKHCGDGFYGIRVHQSVLESGDKESGATVHFVDEGTDTGAIILQQSIKVKDDDTPEVLQGRVLKVEHKLLPLAIKLLVEDKVILNNGKVVIKN